MKIDKFLKAFVAAAVMLTAVPAVAETYVASWNIRNLGWDNDKDFAALAEIGGAFDFIAVQEVMSEEGLEDFVDALETRTGSDWTSMASHAIGRGSYKEHYAFVWKDAKVTWLDGAAVYLDDRDIFSREPYSARFRTHDGVDFLVGTAHLIYGDTVEGREAEARALAGYRDWLYENFPGTPLFIMGDFNLTPDNGAWGPLSSSMRPLLRDGGTTLSKRDGQYANLYDNIWVQSEVALPISGWGIMKFPERLGVSHEIARASISDHAPVWVSLDASVDPIVFPPYMPQNPHLVEKTSTAGGNNTASQDVTEGNVMGNKNSDIYHLPGCSGFTRTSPKNRVWFNTEAEAVSAGFRRAKNC
ncbi:MAG: endonuclease/exonuclease/phosphatase family protein [Roseibium sp.]|uniref:endonuclease/exonuclease/phosphatase family protein n=1 Tax=Roseibium sp. TaxID=1936156 RepID=UPI00329794E1